MRKQIAAVTVVTAVAHAAGLLKLWLIAKIFGVGAELDGYNLGLVIPTFISGVLAGVLQPAFFPVRARLAVTTDTAELESFERSVLVVLFVCGLVIATCLLFLRSAVLGVFTADADEEVRVATAYVFPYALLLIPLNAVGEGLNYLLAFRDRYHWAAAAPIGNALFSALLLAVWPEGRLLNLTIGTVLGLAFQLSLSVWALSRTELRLLGRVANIAEYAQSWRTMLQAGGWVLPGVLVSNLTGTLPPVLVAPYGVGAVSAFGYAWRLHTVAIQLLVMASGPVLVAKFAELVARGEHESVRKALGVALGLSIVVGAAAVLGVGVLGDPLLHVLFGGRLDQEAVQSITAQWRWLALALGPALLSNVFAKLWQASGRAKLLTVLASAGFGVFLIAAYLLRPALGAQAVGAAVALSALSIVIFGWRFAWTKQGGL